MRVNTLTAISFAVQEASAPETMSQTSWNERDAGPAWVSIFSARMPHLSTDVNEGGGDDRCHCMGDCILVGAAFKQRTCHHITAAPENGSKQSTFIDTVLIPREGI